MSQISVLFGQLLKYLYDISGNYALSIILFTIATRFILLPLTFSQMRSMNAMKKIQPKVDEINKKYKGNPQKQNEHLSKLYKENKINPAAGCLPLFIQLPIMIGMYRVIQEPVKYVFKSEEAYKLVDLSFFWIKSLSDADTLMLSETLSIPFILPFLSAFFTYLQFKMSMSKSSNSSNATSDSMNKTMLYMMPLMMLFWGIRLPSGLILYWTTGTIVQIIQQFLIGKYEDKIGNIEDNFVNTNKDTKTKNVKTVKKVRKVRKIKKED